MKSLKKNLYKKKWILKVIENYVFEHINRFINWNKTDVEYISDTLMLHKLLSCS